MPRRREASSHRVHHAAVGAEAQGMVHQDQGLPVGQDEAAVHDRPLQAGGTQAVNNRPSMLRELRRMAHNILPMPIAGRPDGLRQMHLGVHVPQMQSVQPGA